MNSDKTILRLAPKSQMTQQDSAEHQELLAVFFDECAASARAGKLKTIIGIIETDQGLVHKRVGFRLTHEHAVGLAHRLLHVLQTDRDKGII